MEDFVFVCFFDMLIIGRKKSSLNTQADFTLQFLTSSNVTAQSNLSLLFDNIFFFFFLLYICMSPTLQLILKKHFCDNGDMKSPKLDASFYSLIFHFWNVYPNSSSFRVLNVPSKIPKWLFRWPCFSFRSNELKTLERKLIKYYSFKHGCIKG